MLKEELVHVLSGNRDHVDEQFSKNNNLILGRVVHAMCSRRGTVTIGQDHMRVASSVLWAYYRHIYYRQANYGSLVIVLPEKGLTDLVAVMIGAVLGMREQEHAVTDAGKLCPAMRDSKEAVPFVHSRLITGLPFDGLMSWDINNLMASCSLPESIFLTTEHPSKWAVTATKKGEVVRVEHSVDEVFDLMATIKEVKRT